MVTVDKHRVLVKESKTQERTTRLGRLSRTAGLLDSLVRVATLESEAKGGGGWGGAKGFSRRK